MFQKPELPYNHNSYFLIPFRGTCLILFDRDLLIFFHFFFFLLGKHNLMSVKFVLWKNISIDKMGVVRVSHIQFLLRNRREAETGMLQN